METEKRILRRIQEKWTEEFKERTPKSNRGQECTRMKYTKDQRLDILCKSEAVEVEVYEAIQSIVFASKYLRQVIYGELRVEIGQTLRELCEQKGIEIL